MKLRSERLKILGRCYCLLGDKKKLFSRLTACKVLDLLLLLAAPYFYYLFINNVITNGDLAYLPLAVAGYVGVFAAQSLLIRYTRKTYNTLFIRLKAELRVSMLKRYANMKTAEYGGYSTGDLHNRIDRDVELVETFLQTHVLDYFFALAGSLIISAILFALNPLLTVIGFVAIPLSFWFGHSVSKRANRVAEEKRRFEGEYESFLNHSFQNWADIKTNNLEEHMTQRFREYKKRLSKLIVKHQVYIAVNWLFMAFKDYFITRMNLYFAGGLLIIYGKLTVGILLTFMDYFLKLVGNITAVVNSNLGLSSQKPNLERVFEILDMEYEVKKPVRGLGDEVIFSKVSFWYYETQEPVVRSLDLRVNPGEHVALVGRSGCGKSTLAGLLMGMYEPRGGEILIGGCPVSKLSYEDISRKIGIVSQFSQMLNLTIRENLQLADRDADEERLLEACRRADILSFVESLPQKLDTNVGERGVKLSGGQKQRLAIARILLQDPDIIIFDESTSSLDSCNEQEILKTIRELAADRTIMTIAHRLSTILICDRAVLMEKGEIVAEEKPGEMFGNEKFAALFQQQC